MLARTRLHEIVFRSSLLRSVCISAAVATAYHLECDSEGPSVGRWTPFLGFSSRCQELTFSSNRRSGPMRRGRDNSFPRRIPHGSNLPMPTAYLLKAIPSQGGSPAEACHC
ncbi:hypothetical protein ACQKWADRAFT_289471 [Trichoderma austrokoningii]